MSKKHGTPMEAKPQLWLKMAAQFLRAAIYCLSHFEDSLEPAERAALARAKALITDVATGVIVTAARHCGPEAMAHERTLAYHVIGKCLKGWPDVSKQVLIHTSPPPPKEAERIARS